MDAWFPRLKRKIILVVGVALVVAGSVPVLYFVALFLWQITTLFLGGSWVALPATLLFTAHSLAFVPQFPEALVPAHTAVTWILGGVHLGLVFALVGLPVIGVGVVLWLQQRAAIRAEQQRQGDAQRRIRDYRGQSSRPDDVDGRREPFIGSGGTGRGADRRAA